MSPARRATPEDAEELVRLRQVMFDSLANSPTRSRAEFSGEGDTAWEPAAVATLRDRLADLDGDFAAFVMDCPEMGTRDPRRLAACAVGTIEHRLGSPHNPLGLSGHVFNVATDPEQRRQGHSRACMEALLDWYRTRGVRKIDLHASSAGEPLYTSLGFARSPDPSMRLSL
jgi:ribosomal protein S18 acetylase RimI-like enzyme